MRRSAPTSNKNKSSAEQSSIKLDLSSQDPKQYLFSKMFQHCENNINDNFSGLKIYLNKIKINV